MSPFDRAHTIFHSPFVDTLRDTIDGIFYVCSKADGRDILI